jgi:CxxH/CxxC protein (TIGR04129 family)
MWIKGDENMFVCCEEHIDLAIDMYVDKMEQAPNISFVSVDKSEKSCDFCTNKAAYIVEN